MSELILKDAIDAIGVLKAQQQADAHVIKALVIAVASGGSLREAWMKALPAASVDELLFAQSNTFGKDALEAFNDRIAYWNENLRGLLD